MTSLLRSVWATCIAVVLIGAVTQAAGPNKEVTHRFKISLATGFDMIFKDKKTRLTHEMRIHYNWMRNDRERVLCFESLFVKADMDGKVFRHGFRSREKITNTKKGKTNEVPFEKVPEEVKKRLQAYFDFPLCKLQVDENGKEIKRTVVARPRAKVLSDTGLIAYAILFHPPFLRNQDEWQAATEIPLGDHGGYAKGMLVYKKTTSGKSGQLVKVSGTLANEAYKFPDFSLTIRKANFSVRGEQTYDPSQQEWVSGKFTIDVSYQLFDNDIEKVIRITTGTIVINFEKLSDK